jgi:cbb3-type cytochrome oxidase maturation protein
MSVIILLLFASISVAALFLIAFIWSVKSGQYDDEVSPAVRILFDDKPKSVKGKEVLTTTNNPNHKPKL